MAGATALLVLVGFGFKVAAVPFHQWAPDTYEGAPAPVTAWIASGSKVASFVALIKVLVFALGPWASNPKSLTAPGWVGIVAVIAAVTMTYGNFAALAQRNLKRMLAYSSIAHAGYMLVGVLAASVSQHKDEAVGAVLFYLVVYSLPGRSPPSRSPPGWPATRGATTSATSTASVPRRPAWRSASSS